MSKRFSFLLKPNTRGHLRKCKTCYFMYKVMKKKEEEGHLIFVVSTVNKAYFKFYMEFGVF